MMMIDEHEKCHRYQARLLAEHGHLHDRNVDLLVSQDRWFGAAVVGWLLFVIVIAMRYFGW